MSSSLGKSSRPPHITNPSWVSRMKQKIFCLLKKQLGLDSVEFVVFKKPFGKFLLRLQLRCHFWETRQVQSTLPVHGDKRKETKRKKGKKRISDFKLPDHKRKFFCYEIPVTLKILFHFVFSFLLFMTTAAAAAIFSNMFLISPTFSVT